MANPRSLNFDTPIFADQPAENSPVSSLAINLSSTNISIPVRRKLSLVSNVSGSAAVSPGSPMAISPANTPHGDRLLKSNLCFTSTTTPVGTGNAGRRLGIPRRLSQMGDENYNPLQSSPLKHNISPSKFLAVRQLSSGSRARHPLEDHDPNSQDSGYCYSEDSKSASSSDFPFVQPSGLAPRRSVPDSPRSTCHSTSSNESCDDGFNDFISPLQDEEAQQELPSGLGDLIKDPIINKGLSSDSLHVFTFTHCISENVSSPSPMVEESGRKRPSITPLEHTPVSKRHKPLTADNKSTSPRTQQNTLFHYGFKRLDEPRPLLGHSISLEERVSPAPRPKFRHCLSESEAVIKRALHRSSEEELIGDFSRTFALPLTPGNHQDLKSITPSTLARLINGEFSESIASFQIIDCRYPYEFDGGHIQGARNIYTKDQVIKEFLENRSTLVPRKDNSKREIIIFHCEFSSERGPGLSRFLRSKDRENNAYPALHYPELYLLEGGYKAFFNTHQELCEPCAYRKMVDADKDQLQHFRAKSKTWSGDKSQRMLKRSTSFKRLGL